MSGFLRVTSVPARVTVMIAIVVCLGVFDGSEGLSHIRDGNPKRWYPGGKTYELKDGKWKKVDPVNLLFYGGPASLDQVGTHLFIHWGSGSVMGQWGCLASKQHMLWRALGDYRTGQPLYKREAQNRSWSTSSVCPGGAQYHIRAWDDGAHDEQTISHGVQGQWTIGNVHRERLCWKNNRPNHCVNLDWDAAERFARRQLSEHCGFVRWRLHAGAVGLFGNYRSDGYITNIMTLHRPPSGLACPSPPPLG